MRHLLAASLALFAATAWGEDSVAPPELPQATSLPETAYLQIVSPEGKTRLSIKRIESGMITYTRQHTVNQAVVETVNGQQVTKLVPVIATTTIAEQIPTRWREVLVDLEQAELQTADGKKIPQKEWGKRLAKPTIVVTATDNPPDPFFLATLKPETLVVISTQEALFPPRDPPAPRKVKIARVVNGRVVEEEVDVPPPGATPIAPSAPPPPARPRRVGPGGGGESSAPPR